MTTPPTTMNCPGCGKPDVPRALVACAPCWRQVPDEIVRQINRTKPNTFGRVRAVGDARNWLKANAR